ncbi:Pre-mRNA-splicing factor dre4 [Podospora conica]|nr:Pre-mRNA-splicing factor dre4 [Schizothecium conicum]
MLKSTYKPSAAALQPLLPGWTEHKAPTGHTYYYNAATKESTYKRPVAAPSAPPPFPPPFVAPQVNLSDPNIANAFLAQNAPQPAHQSSNRGGFGGERGGRGGGFQPRPRPQPTDKPRSKVAIPGHEPWILVYTKLNRRFAYNPVKNASYWRIPEKLMPAILELDQARIRQKAAAENPPATTTTPTTGETTVPNRPGAAPAAPEPHDYDSSEYEEVEVTDSEDDDPSHPKRQRTEDPAPSGPVEFTEADIAAQLAAMNADYASSYASEDDASAPEPLSEADATALFHDLLTDLRINPYTPFLTLLEQPTISEKLTSDPRYLVLPTTRARKDAWEAWSRSRIQQLKEERAKQEKTDPRVAYLEFLQERATPKLYWPEFRRKYKREACMKDSAGGVAFGDKEREKLYREYIARVKTSVGERKGELKALLAGQGARALNCQTVVPEGVPGAVRADVRWVVLDRKTRDEFVEGYVRGLGPPPEEEEGGGEEERAAAEKARVERRKRERALEERERAVAEEKRRQEKRLGFERARLREEERELERAMVVDKKGLRGQLVGDKMEE